MDHTCIAFAFSNEGSIRVGWGWEAEGFGEGFTSARRRASTAKPRPTSTPRSPSPAWRIWPAQGITTILIRPLSASSQLDAPPPDAEDDDPFAALSEADDAASTAVSVWKRAPEALKAPGQPLWPALLEVLQQDAQTDALPKVLQERLQQHCESVTIDAMNGLSDKQLLKMKKALNNCGHQ